MSESEPQRLTEEDLYNIRQRLAASIHLRAALTLATQLQASSEGQKFLHQWASEQRLKSQAATAPKVPPSISLLLGDEYREIVEAMLGQMGL